MKKFKLLATILATGLLSFATVSCGETKNGNLPNIEENGGNGGNTNNGGGTSDNTDPSKPKTIVATVSEALALSFDKKTPDYYEITGTLSEVTERTNEDNKQTYNFKLTDNTGTIFSWGVDDPIPAGLKNGAKAKVNGKLSKFEGNIQFNYPKVTILAGGNGGAGGDTDNNETVDPKAPTIANPAGCTSVADLLTEARKLSAGQKGNTEYYLCGVVDRLYHKDHHTCYVSDGNEEIKLYIKDDDYNALPASKKYVVGDTVLAKGKLECYKPKDGPLSYSYCDVTIIEVKKA